MELNTQAQDLQGNSRMIVLTSIPDTCPICHTSIHPKYMCSSVSLQRELVQAVFRCTSQKCEEMFIATYKTDKNRSPHPCVFESIAPKVFHKQEFPTDIQDVSPSFISIFNQAIAAEAIDLTEMVGIGLRKALEYLIKDFLIHQDSSKQEEIKKAYLGKCITDYIEDPNVKRCAKRAAWLGNDETHYTRKWEDKDVGDLKRLIKLTVNWIDNVLLTQKYIDEMGEPGTDG